MTYPKRGEMSEDGKFYTHTEGSVYSVVKTDYCTECFLRNECNLGKHFIGCRFAKCSVVEGAYVPSAEEQEACDMALAMIRVCTYRDGHGGCFKCSYREIHKCPARAYLAVHGATDAWEVTP